MSYICEKCNISFEFKIGLINHLKRKISCEKYSSKCLNPECLNNVKYPNRFCSSKCAGKVNSPGRKHLAETRKKISISNGGVGDVSSKFCLNCGKKVQNKFCNNTCMSEYKTNVLINEWLNGKLDGNSESWGHASYVKKYLLKKYNNKCSRCGWNEINPYSKTIPLEVEHIDGNPFNNDPNNVTLLCPNCHSLTKTYKGANRGNGKRKESIIMKNIKKVSACNSTG